MNCSEVSKILPQVGYWWSDKKSKKLKVCDFIEACREAGFELKKIDINRPIEEQGPFVAIVHKLSDLIIKGEKGDLESRATCIAFQEYCDNHPDVIIIDPLPNIHKLLDRCRQYKNVDDSEFRKYGGIFVPSFVEFTSTDVTENIAKMKAANVTFPCVCKPSVAHTALSHEMCLVFNEEGLKDVTPPCVAQSFVNHNAILYKLFVVGNSYFVITRPSLKNFSAGNYKTIFFYSNMISKPHSACELTELDENEPKTSPIQPDKNKLDHIIEMLCKRLGMNLFGVDVIIANETGHYGIVDVNVFPGYDEVKHFFRLLTNLIVEKLALNRCKVPYMPKPVLSDLIFQPTALKYSDLENLDVHYDETSGITIICKDSDFHCNAYKTSYDDNEQKLDTSVKLSLILQNANIKHEEKCPKTVDIECKKLNSPDNAQDDSGIETSDSCDEKKKATIFRNVKRQHSRNHQAVGLAKSHLQG